MEVRSNRIGDIRHYYKERLLENFKEKEADALLFSLIEEFTGISKAKSISDPGITVSESELLKIHFAVRDLNRNKPVQYVLGKTEFCGLSLKVNPDVLIPRPETEELVGLIIKENLNRQKLRIIDIGTGSGCIAIAIKNILPDCQVTATDISAEALKLARTNALSNGVEIEFMHFDFLDYSKWNQLSKFDIVVSNPPYIRISEKTEMAKNVLDYEPAHALFVSDENPLIFYRAISKFAAKCLTEEGILYCEINQYLGNEVLNLFIKSNNFNANILRDLNGNDRFIRAELSK